MNSESLQRPPKGDCCSEPASKSRDDRALPACQRVSASDRRGRRKLHALRPRDQPAPLRRKTDALKSAAKEIGAWQKLNLKVIGPRMEAKLNDVLITVSDAIEPAAGHLGLLGKTGQLEWKNVTIRVHPD